MKETISKVKRQLSEWEEIIYLYIYIYIDILYIGI